jgi:hypothetical protein
MRPTDHLDSNYNFDIKIEKLANGFTKASAAGLEANDRDQTTAVTRSSRNSARAFSPATSTQAKTKDPRVNERISFEEAILMRSFSRIISSR